MSSMRRSALTAASGLVSARGHRTWATLAPFGVRGLCTSQVWPQFSPLDPSTELGQAACGSLLERMATTRRTVGDYVPKAVTQDLCAAYTSWPPTARRAFLQQLADLGTGSNEAEAVALKEAANAFVAVRFPEEGPEPSDVSVDTFGRAEQGLRAALMPLHEHVIQQLVAHNQAEGMHFVVGMRGDLLSYLRRADCGRLRYLDSTMSNLLKGWFSEGFLQLDRVTWESSSGSLLEKIGDGEKVHKMSRQFSELKVRLGPGRRCFAFTHPSMPGEPLVFIHVALVPKMASNMHELAVETGPDSLCGGGSGQEGAAGAAIFWSISATQPGLVGVDLGAFLIKKVVTRLQEEWPSLAGADPAAGMPNGFIFSTLSPIPNFTAWLEKRLRAFSSDAAANILLDSEVDALKATWQVTSSVAVVDRLIQELNSMKSQPDTAPCAFVSDGALKDVLTRVCVRYLLQEKRKGRAACPVANFHIRNGATLQRVNWGADLSPNGLSQSCGLMINYQYHLPQLEQNHRQYVQDGTIPRSDEAQRLLISASA